MAEKFEKRFDNANLLLESKDFAAACTIYTQILDEDPHNSRALHALGVVLYQGWGKSREAVRFIRKALALKGNFSEAYNSLAKILQESRRIRSAIICYRKAVDLDPDNHVAWVNLGIVYSLVKKSEDALLAFQDAIRLVPDSFDALMGIGRALIEMKRYQESLEYFGKAEGLAPDEPKAYYGAALAHKQLNQLSLARTKLLRSLELKQDFAEAYHGLADVLLKMGDAEGSVQAIRKALALKPDFKDAHAFLLFALHYPSTTTQQELYDETIAFCQRYCGQIPRFTNYDNDRDPHRILRIGYISGEFNRHPVGFFVEQTLAFHDPAVITIYCYSNGPATDWVTERLKTYANVWHDISRLNDETVSQLIRKDEIDILVDLSGLIGCGRIDVMARKPAPVQVSWIGYYNTIGLDTIDYILMDVDTVPANMIRWFTERIVYLPESRLCYTPPPDLFTVKPLPALSNGFVTFGCFNNIAKITPEIIEVWSNILSQMPDALLVLKWDSFVDASVVERFQAMFARHGIGATRVEFRQSSSYDILLDEYGDIDIALDPFPFSGATTTCESLWMGVPVITMPGPIPASRQSFALLRIVGLPDYIADSRDSYVELALHHARDLEVLSGLRQRLRGMMAMSPLCDGLRFTAELESAYRIMWQQWCEGKTCDGDRRPIEVPPAFSNVTGNNMVTYVSATPEAAYNRGVSYLSANHLREAKRFFEQAYALKPDFPEALNNLGIVSYYLGDLEVAESWLAKAIKLRPAFVEALNNQGRVLTERNKQREARQAFSEVLRLDPCHHQAWNNLGELHRNAGRVAKARACFRKSLYHRPDFHDALNNMAALYLHYNAEKSFIAYQSLVALYPENADIHSALLFAMHYSDTFSREEIFSKICNVGERFYTASLDSSSRQTPSGNAEHRPLRIGFVSSDFHQHPGGVFFQALARHHNRAQFSLVCYDNSGKADLITDDIKRRVAGWRSVAGTMDDELINLILSDKIDILIDLSGHSAGHRLPVFARKPAPIQASWLGWFNTTGIKAIDYLVVDPEMVQAGEEQYFVEKLAFLPQGRFCYTAPFMCPDVEALPARDNHFITFGCFNNLSKITNEVVAVWAAILEMVPLSRLVLKSSYFRDYEMRRRYLKRFMAHGISVERIELRQQSLHFFMMTEYNDIDIALDPFPYSGGLTSCEALWMGVPVVTMPGELPVSRQTASFLKAVGLPGCIARDRHEYIDRACELAADIEYLASVRAGLRERMAGSSLCDAQQFSKDFGEILIKMWMDTMVTV